MYDALIFDIVLKSPLKYQQAWLKDRNKKLHIFRSVQKLKNMLKVYKMIKNSGQQVFNLD
jgi:hypothetical protein